MKIKIQPLLVAIGLVVILVLGGGLYTVPQTHQAIVLRLGRQVKPNPTTGLNIKVPFIDDVLFFERRVIAFDLPEVSITTVDQKRLFVDTYTRYRIQNPDIFFQQVKPADEKGAAIQLQNYVSSSVRNVLGKIPLRTMLSTERASVMKKIEAEVGAKMKERGVEIIDVRIIRTELPKENHKSVFDRMNSELDRIAKGNRAEGEKIGQQIRSEAEKNRTILLAESQKKAQKLRGEGEAKAAQVTAESLGKDPEFYSFYRSLQAYRNTLGTGTTMVLSSDNEMLRFLKSSEKLGK